MKPSRKFSVGWLMPALLLLGLLTVYVLFLYLLGGRTQAKTIIKKAQENPGNPDDDTTRILKLISKTWPNGIHPYFLTAIAMHETGNFTSDVFRNNNNLFGMRHPEHRPTKSTGDLNGYATYKSLQDSVRDFKEWIMYNGLPSNYENVSDLVSDMKDKEYYEASYLRYNEACVNNVLHLLDVYGEP
jgi:uncharacterized FlgJ-related protein